MVRHRLQRLLIWGQDRAETEIGKPSDIVGIINNDAASGATLACVSIKTTTTEYVVPV
jgi:hypothetical protein